MSNDNTRRAEFLAYFKDKLNSDRQVILDSGISKGRVTQYFDEGEPFGELAAKNLEKRLNVQLGTVFHSLRVATPEAKRADSLGGAIPVVGSAQLGDNGHFCDLEYPVGHGDGSIDWPTKDPNAYALRCNGESMKPRIRHGRKALDSRSYLPSPTATLRRRRPYQAQPVSKSRVQARQPMPS